MAKENQPRGKPLGTRPPAVLTMNGGKTFVLRGSSIRGAYIPPRRWVCCWQKPLLSCRGRRLGGRRACANKGAWQRAKILAFTPRVRLPCSHLYQNANAKSVFLTLRKNIGGALRRQFLRTHGFQGATLGTLSWFVLCRAAKNEHPKTAQRGAKLYARPKEKSLELSIVLIFQHLVRKIFTIIPPKTLDFSPILLYNELSNE